MHKDPTIYQKIQKQTTQPSNQLLTVKLQKIKFYISNTDEEIPSLSADHQDKVGTQLRMYFNDPELLIFKNHISPQNYFEDKQYQQKIKKIFNQFLQSNSINIQEQIEEKQSSQKQQEQENHQTTTQNKPKQTKKSKLSSMNEPKKIDFIEFLQFWLEKQQKLNVFYDKYNTMVKSSVDVFQNNLYKKVSNTVSRQSSAKQSVKNENIKNQAETKTIQSKPKDRLSQKPTNLKTKKAEVSSQSLKQNQNNDDQKVSKNHIKLNLTQNQSQKGIQPNDKMRQNTQRSVKSQIVHDQQPRDTYNYYLRKYYQHYCKKSANTIKNQQFNKLQQFYNSMNLTKFMMYCKQVKVLKLDKQITVKYLQHAFKLNQNKDHVLEYEAFSKIVGEILLIAFKEKQEVQTKGYEAIGVKNRPNFAQTMGKIGVIIPLKKIVFSKAQQMRSLSRMVKSRTKQQTLNLKQSKLLLKDSPLINLKNGGYGHGYQSYWDSNQVHKDLFLNEKQRKQQKLLQNLTIPKLNKLQPSKQIDQKMQQLVDQQYDPYLKRYNDKNKSSHDGTSAVNYGLIKRIDDRIQNVVKKMR